MKILFIVNPTSGRTSNEILVDQTKSLAASKDIDLKVLNTTGENDDLYIQKMLQSFKPDRVIAGGGDGTVQLVARNLVGSDFLFGILPMGSANGMAKAIGIPPSSIETVETLLDADHFVRMDMLKFNDKHLCIHLGDIGVNALMVKKYGRENTKGMIGYAKHLLSSIQESPLLRYNIRTPEGSFDREGFVLAFANAHKYGTGVHISAGEIWDGKFEICNVPEITVNNAIKAGLTILNVFVDKEMFSDVITCTNAEVTIDLPTHFQIDGEYMGMVKELKIDIIPGAVKLLLS